MTSRGFFTIAQGEDYQRMAYALALSLKISQPADLSKLSIGVTAEEIDSVKANPKYKMVFDTIQEIPWKDHAKNSSWKLENEWKSIHMTPYDETIKLDADMLFPSDISEWWKYLTNSEGVFCIEPRTYHGGIISSDYYRKTFTESELPNAYTAMFYFKKTPANFELFALAEDIFNNWEAYFYEFLLPEHRPNIVSTDVVFALAAKILDYEQLDKTSHLGIPTFVHMKSRLQDWPTDSYMTEDWTSLVPTYFSHDCVLKVGNYRQTLPFHYHVKHFITDSMIKKMEKRLGI